MTTMRQKGGGMTDKLMPVLVIVSIVLAFAVGFMWQKIANLEKGGVANLGALPAQQPPAPSNGKLSSDQVGTIPQVSATDHILGNKDAKVLLVEYSDLECPFCQRFHPTANQVIEEYGGEVAWVYRHFPLDSLHPKARSAAEASECVAELGGDDAFWTFVDEIFADQTAALSDIAATAAKAGVNKSEVEKCMDSGKYANKVTDQYNGGSSAGVTGTPGNFIITSDWENAWVFPGAVPFESLKPVIDEALAS